MSDLHFVCVAEKNGIQVEISMPLAALDEFEGHTLSEKRTSAAQALKKGSAEIAAVFEAFEQADQALDAANAAFVRLDVAESAASDALSCVVGGVPVRVLARCGDKESVIAAASGASTGKRRGA